MDASEPERRTYWDLLADIARLQGEMAQDLVAWSEAYAAGGRAFQHTARTLGLVADIGRRAEQQLRTGPDAAVRQTLQLFAQPLAVSGLLPGAGVSDPFVRFWDAWAANMARAQPTTAAGEGGKPEAS